MTAKKRIGVLACKTAENGAISVPSAYAAFFSNFGNVVPISVFDDYVQQVDMLVLVGGADVYPPRYGKKPDYNTQNPNVGLEWFDENVLPEYMAANIPILGICRGFQTLNVSFGGQLSQHIDQAYSAPRSEKVDDITITLEGAPLCTELGILSPAQTFNQNVRKNNFKVNSLHHQGVFIKDLGENVIPLLVNEKKRNVEALQIADRNIFGVQWHPEEVYDDFSIKLINKLLQK